MDKLELKLVIDGREVLNAEGEIDRVSNVPFLVRKIKYTIPESLACSPLVVEQSDLLGIYQEFDRIGRLIRKDYKIFSEFTHNVEKTKKEAQPEMLEV